MIKNAHILALVSAILLGAPVAAHTLWVPLPDVPVPVAGYGLAQAYGRIYLINGWAGWFSDYTQEFDPITSTWAMRSNRPHGSVDVACAAVDIGANFHLIFVGGGSGSQGTFDHYYPVLDEWTERPNAPFLERGGAVAADLGDHKLHVLGGFWNAERLNDHAVFNPLTSEWTLAAPVPNTQGGMAAAVEGRKLRVAGGEVWDPVLRIFRGLPGHALYDRDTAAWTTQPDIPTGQPYYYGGVNVDGVFYACSGSAHFRYDLASSTWTPLSGHPYNLSRGGGVAINGVPVWFSGFSGTSRLGTPFAFYEAVFFVDGAAPFGGNGMPDSPFRDFTQAIGAIPPGFPQLVWLMTRPGIYAEAAAYNFDRPAEIRKWGAGGDIQIRQ